MKEYVIYNLEQGREKGVMMRDTDPVKVQERFVEMLEDINDSRVMDVPPVSIFDYGYYVEEVNVPTLQDYTTIKTYDDACSALGEHLNESELRKAGVPAHIIALMKLELVCKALWGGENKCQPTKQVYWWPWFAFWTKSEMADMSDDERKCLLSALAHLWHECGVRCSAREHS